MICRCCREQWKGYTPAPYHPVVIDGYPVTDDREQVGAAIGSAVASEAKRTRAEEIRAAQHEVNKVFTIVLRFKL